MAKVDSTLQNCSTMDYTNVVVETVDSPNPLQYITLCTRTLGNLWQKNHLVKKLLIIYDDISKPTQHSRHMSLPLRRSVPPGQEAHLGDVFNLYFPSLG